MSLFLAVSLNGSSVPLLKRELAPTPVDKLKSSAWKSPGETPNCLPTLPFLLRLLLLSAWVGTFSLSQEKKKQRKCAMNYPPPTDMNVVQRLVTVYWGALIKIRDKSLGGGQPSNQDVWLASWMTLKRVGPCVTCVRRPMCFMSDVSHHHTLLLFRPAADICCSLAAGASLKNYVCLYWRQLRTEVWLHQHLRFLCFLFFFVIFWWWLSVMSHFALPKLTHLIIHHQYDTPARQSIENYTLHITSP